MHTFYIQIKDGVPVNHPAYENNLMEAFGKIPANWELFERREPDLTTFQMLVSQKPKYEKVNGKWADVWSKREMTSEEKAAKDVVIAAELVKMRGQSTMNVTII